MHLKFEAQEVTYNDALDGDIIQVSFQEFYEPDVDYSKHNAPLPSPIKGVTFSANYEFPPCETTVEWCDGNDYDGGQQIKEIELIKSSLKAVLENGLLIEIKFNTDDLTFKKIYDFLVA